MNKKTSTLSRWSIGCSILFLIAGSAAAEIPADLEKVDMYLHTVDVGVPIHAKYGHTQIRVVDRNSGSDVAYTWGIFDYRDPQFALKFYRGIMRYRIGVYDIDQAMDIYQYEGRKVWEDKLNLSVSQKRKLLEAIEWQLLPENREYNYLYFFDNCSTRPRDLLDTTLDGAFKKFFAGKDAQYSFRDMVRIHQATTPLTGIALEVTMNGRLDRTMTVWEEMFLPRALRAYLLTMPNPEGATNPDVAGPLLQPVRILVDAPTPAADFILDERITYSVFGIPGLLMLIAGFRRRFGMDGGSVPAVVFRMFGVFFTAWGALAGTFGTVMLVSWFASNHLDLKHNANLWLFWPTDFVFAFLGLKIMAAGQTISISRLHFTRLKNYLLAHLGGLAIVLVLALTGLITQDVFRVVKVFGVIGLIMSYAAFRHAIEPKES
jgi:hypothetical protein